MATYSFECEYTISVADEIEAESFEEARELIAESYYACNAQGGFSESWDYINIQSLELEEEDEG
jgi:hypothetical protein